MPGARRNPCRGVAVRSRQAYALAHPLNYAIMQGDDPLAAYRRIVPQADMLLMTVLAVDR